MKIKILLTLLCLSALGFAQAARFDSQSWTTATIVGQSGIVKTVPAAQVTVCTYPAATFGACTKVALCTDSTMSSCSTGSNPVTADSSGNFGFWVAPGQYDYWITAFGSNVGPYHITLGQDSNGVCYANNYSGADIVAKIGAAYATGSCRIIKVRTGDYAASTTTSFATNASPVIIDGQGSSITYSGSGTLFTFNTGQGHLPNIGLQNLVLNGNSGTTALLLGGSLGAEGFTAISVKIAGFAVGVNFGSNTYNVKFDHVIFSDNVQAVNIGTSLTNFGEQVLFQNVAFSNTVSGNFTNCFVVTAYTGLNLNLKNSLVDNCQIVLNNNGVTGQLANVGVEGTHFEDPNFAINALGPFVLHNGGANLTIDSNTDFMDEKGASSVLYPIVATAGGATYLDGPKLFTGSNTAAFVNLNGSSHRLIGHAAMYRDVTGPIGAIPVFANSSGSVVWVWGDTDADNYAQTSGLFDFRSGNQGANSARFQLSNNSGTQAQFNFYKWTGVGSNFYGYALRPDNNEVDFCEGGSAVIGSHAWSCNARIKQTGAGEFDGGVTAGGGTKVAKIAKVTAALSPSAVAANTCAEQSLTVTGLDASSFIVNAAKTANQAGLSYGGYRVTGANTVAVNFCNNTASPITPTASESWTFWFIR